MFHKTWKSEEPKAIIGDAKAMRKVSVVKIALGMDAVSVQAIFRIRRITSWVTPTKSEI